MSKLIKLIVTLSIAIILSACAGTNFVRPTDETFVLGKTTYSQVVQQLGEPKRQGTFIKNDKTLKNITYAYATTVGEPLEKEVIPTRAMSYYFSDNVLVGREFISSFKSDNSNFDDTKITVITKGKTTRAEVVQLLGRPSAFYIAPMVKTTSGEALGYNYSAIKGGTFAGFKVFKKALLVSFNESGQVSDIDFSSSNNK